MTNSSGFWENLIPPPTSVCSHWRILIQNLREAPHPSTSTRKIRHSPLFQYVCYIAFHFYWIFCFAYLGHLVKYVKRCCQQNTQDRSLINLRDVSKPDKHIVCLTAKRILFFLPADSHCQLQRKICQYQWSDFQAGRHGSTGNTRRGET